MKKVVIDGTLRTIYLDTIKDLQKQLDALESGYSFKDDEYILVPTKMTWKLLYELEVYFLENGLESHKFVSDIIREKIESK